MKKILIAGAGGFIGGHLVKKLINSGHKVRAVDIKKFDEWFQLYSKNRFYSFGLTSKIDIDNTSLKTSASAGSFTYASSSSASVSAM